MSLSSVAQDSALRLTPIGSVAPSLQAVATTAATAAAAASTAGATEIEAANAGEDAAAATQGPAPSVPSGPLATLVKYIPTETITLYIAIQAALGEVKLPKSRVVSDADFSSRWVWLGIMFAVTVLLGTALAYRAQKVTKQDAKFKWPIFDVTAAGAAFLIWALSLPSTPLRDFEGYDYSAWNSVLILGGTMAVATAAYAFGKTVAWEKVLTDS
jgi:hypothetical protein